VRAESRYVPKECGWRQCCYSEYYPPYCPSSYRIAPNTLNQQDLVVTRERKCRAEVGSGGLVPSSCGGFNGGGTNYPPVTNSISIVPENPEQQLSAQPDPDLQQSTDASCILAESAVCCKNNPSSSCSFFEYGGVDEKRFFCPNSEWYGNPFIYQIFSNGYTRTTTCCCTEAHNRCRTGWDGPVDSPCTICLNSDVCIHGTCTNQACQCEDGYIKNTGGSCKLCQAHFNPEGDVSKLSGFCRLKPLAIADVTADSWKAHDVVKNDIFLFASSNFDLVDADTYSIYIIGTTSLVVTERDGRSPCQDMGPDIFVTGRSIVRAQCRSDGPDLCGLCGGTYHSRNDRIYISCDTLYEDTDGARKDNCEVECQDQRKRINVQVKYTCTPVSLPYPRVTGNFSRITVRCDSDGEVNSGAYQLSDEQRALLQGNIIEGGWRVQMTYEMFIKNGGRSDRVKSRAINIEFPNRFDTIAAAVASGDLAPAPASHSRSTCPADVGGRPPLYTCYDDDINGHFNASTYCETCNSGWGSLDCNVCVTPCVAGRFEADTKCNSDGTCRCLPGFAGDHCEICIPAVGCTASNGTTGVCEADIPGTCLCNPGYSGDLCATSADSLCGGRGAPRDDGVSCDCFINYFPSSNDTGVGPCSMFCDIAVSCNGRAVSCSDQGQCICAEGYIGATCEECDTSAGYVTDPLSGNACVRGCSVLGCNMNGTVSDTSDPTGMTPVCSVDDNDVFSCDCVSGFAGDLCQFDLVNDVDCQGAAFGNATVTVVDNQLQCDCGAGLSPNTPELVPGSDKPQGCFECDTNGNFFGVWPQCTFCDPVNSCGVQDNRGQCHLGTGECDCNAPFTGDRCDQCDPPFYNFASGCSVQCERSSTCNDVGDCDEDTGACICDPSADDEQRIVGANCERCELYYFPYPSCNVYCREDDTPEGSGTIGPNEEHTCSNRGTCDASTGACVCQYGYEGSACNLRKDRRYAAAANLKQVSTDAALSFEELTLRWNIEPSSLDQFRAAGELLRDARGYRLVVYPANNIDYADIDAVTAASLTFIVLNIDPPTDDTVFEKVVSGLSPNTEYNVFVQFLYAIDSNNPSPRIDESGSEGANQIGEQIPSGYDSSNAIFASFSTLGSGVAGTPRPHAAIASQKNAIAMEWDEPFMDGDAGRTAWERLVSAQSLLDDSDPGTVNYMIERARVVVLDIEGGWIPVGSQPITATRQFIDTSTEDLAPASMYYYRVSCKALSPVDNDTQLQYCGFSDPIGMLRTAGYGAPRELSAVFVPDTFSFSEDGQQVTSADVRLSWYVPEYSTGPSMNAPSQYSVCWRAPGSGMLVCSTASVPVQSPSSVVQYDLSVSPPVQLGSAYEFTVRAIDSSDNSISPTVATTWAATAPQLLAPRSIRVVDKSPNNVSPLSQIDVTLMWTKPLSNGATAANPLVSFKYEAQLRTANGNPVSEDEPWMSLVLPVAALADTNQQQFTGTLGGLTMGSFYAVRVMAVNALGASPPSAELLIRAVDDQYPAPLGATVVQPDITNPNLRVSWLAFSREAGGIFASHPITQYVIDVVRLLPSGVRESLNSIVRAVDESNEGVVLSQRIALLQGDFDLDFEIQIRAYSDSDPADIRNGRSSFLVYRTSKYERNSCRNPTFIPPALGLDPRVALSASVPFDLSFAYNPVPEQSIVTAEGVYMRQMYWFGLYGSNKQYTFDICGLYNVSTNSNSSVTRARPPPLVAAVLVLNDTTLNCPDGRDRSQMYNSMPPAEAFEGPGGDGFSRVFRSRLECSGGTAHSKLSFFAGSGLRYRVVIGVDAEVSNTNDVSVADAEPDSELNLADFVIDVQAEPGDRFLYWSSTGRIALDFSPFDANNVDNNVLSARHHMSLQFTRSARHIREDISLPVQSLFVVATNQRGERPSIVGFDSVQYSLEGVRDRESREINGETLNRSDTYTTSTTAPLELIQQQDINVFVDTRVGPIQENGNTAQEYASLEQPLGFRRTEVYRARIVAADAAIDIETNSGYQFQLRGQCNRDAILQYRLVATLPLSKFECTSKFHRAPTSSITRKNQSDIDAGSDPQHPHCELFIRQGDILALGEGSYPITISYRIIDNRFVTRTRTITRYVKVVGQHVYMQYRYDTTDTLTCDQAPALLPPPPGPPPPEEPGLVQAVKTPSTTSDMIELQDNTADEPQDKSLGVLFDSDDVFNRKPAPPINKRTSIFLKVQLLTTPDIQVEARFAATFTVRWDAAMQRTVFTGSGRKTIRATITIPKILKKLGDLEFRGEGVRETVIAHPKYQAEFKNTLRGRVRSKKNIINKKINDLASKVGGEIKMYVGLFLEIDYKYNSRSATETDMQSGRKRDIPIPDEEIVTIRVGVYFEAKGKAFGDLISFLLRADVSVKFTMNASKGKNSVSMYVSVLLEACVGLICGEIYLDWSPASADFSLPDSASRLQREQHALETVQRYLNNPTHMSQLHGNTLSAKLLSSGEGVRRSVPHSKTEARMFVGRLHHTHHTMTAKDIQQSESDVHAQSSDSHADSDSAIGGALTGTLMHDVYVLAKPDLSVVGPSCLIAVWNSEDESNTAICEDSNIMNFCSNALAIETSVYSTDSHKWTVPSFITMADSESSYPDFGPKLAGTMAVFTRYWNNSAHDPLIWEPFSRDTWQLGLMYATFDVASLSWSEPAPLPTVSGDRRAANDPTALEPQYHPSVAVATNIAGASAADALGANAHNIAYAVVFTSEHSSGDRSMYTNGDSVLMASYFHVPTSAWSTPTAVLPDNVKNIGAADGVNSELYVHPSTLQLIHVVLTVTTETAVNASTFGEAQRHAHLLVRRDQQSWHDVTELLPGQLLATGWYWPGTTDDVDFHMAIHTDGRVIVLWQINNEEPRFVLIDVSSDEAVSSSSPSAPSYIMSIPRSSSTVGEPTLTLTGHGDTDAVLQVQQKYRGTSPGDKQVDRFSIAKCLGDVFTGFTSIDRDGNNAVSQLALAVDPIDETVVAVFRNEVTKPSNAENDLSRTFDFFDIDYVQIANAPDLVPRAISFGTPYLTNDTVAATATIWRSAVRVMVANQGVVPSTATAISLVEGSADGPFLLDPSAIVGRAALGGLASGQSIEVTIDWQRRADRVFAGYVWVIIDEAQIVNELDESNNVFGVYLSNARVNTETARVSQPHDLTIDNRVDIQTCADIASVDRNSAGLLTVRAQVRNLMPFQAFEVPVSVVVQSNEVLLSSTQVLTRSSFDDASAETSIVVEEIGSTVDHITVHVTEELGSTPHIVVSELHSVEAPEIALDTAAFFSGQLVWPVIDLDPESESESESEPESASEDGLVVNITSSNFQPDIYELFAICEVRRSSDIVYISSSLDILTVDPIQGRAQFAVKLRNAGATCVDNVRVSLYGIAHVTEFEDPPEVILPLDDARMTREALEDAGYTLMSESVSFSPAMSTREVLLDASAVRLPVDSATGESVQDQVYHVYAVLDIDNELTRDTEKLDNFASKLIEIRASPEASMLVLSASFYTPVNLNSAASISDMQHTDLAFTAFVQSPEPLARVQVQVFCGVSEAGFAQVAVDLNNDTQAIEAFVANLTRDVGTYTVDLGGITDGCTDVVVRVPKSPATFASVPAGLAECTFLIRPENDDDGLGSLTRIPLDDIRDNNLRECFARTDITAQATAGTPDQSQSAWIITNSAQDPLTIHWTTAAASGQVEVSPGSTVLYTPVAPQLGLEWQSRLVTDRLEIEGTDEVNCGTPVARARDIVLALAHATDRSATTVDVSLVNDGSEASCGIMSMEVDPPTFAPDHLGEQSVIFTITDTQGNSASTGATITVVDNSAPALVDGTCPQDLQLEGPCDVASTGMVVTWKSAPLYNDAVGVQSVVASHTSGDVFELGTTEVFFTATDSSGNANTECSFSITITEDRTPPTVAVRDHINVELSSDIPASASIEVSDVDVGSSDLCGIASMTVSPFAFSCVDVGNSNSSTTQTTLTATDRFGNSAFAVTSVTVADNTPPTLDVRETFELQLIGSQATLSLDDVQISPATDNCGVASVTLNDAPVFTCADALASNNNLPHQVSVTALDVNANEATSTVTVTVVDMSPPSVFVRNVTVVLAGLADAGPDAAAAAGTVSITPSTIDAGTRDNCGIASLSVDREAFDCSHVGTPQVVILTAVDIHGNSASAESYVTVIDDEAPLVSCELQNEQLFFTIPRQESTTSVSWSELTIASGRVRDNCLDYGASVEKTGTGALWTSPYDASQYPSSVSISYTAVDGSGNRAPSCNVTLTIGHVCQNDRDCAFGDDGDSEYCLLNYCGFNDMYDKRSDEPFASSKRICASIDLTTSDGSCPKCHSKDSTAGDKMELYKYVAKGRQYKSQCVALEAVFQMCRQVVDRAESESDDKKKKKNKKSNDHKYPVWLVPRGIDPDCDSDDQSNSIAFPPVPDSGRDKCLLFGPTNGPGQAFCEHFLAEAEEGHMFKSMLAISAGVLLPVVGITMFLARRRKRQNLVQHEQEEQENESTESQSQSQSQSETSDSGLDLDTIRAAYIARDSH
jgi:HYR domain/Laminin EGF domain/EGF-like domain